MSRGKPHVFILLTRVNYWLAPIGGFTVLQHWFAVEVWEMSAQQSLPFALDRALHQQSRYPPPNHLYPPGLAATGIRPEAARAPGEALLICAANYCPKT